MGHASIIYFMYQKVKDNIFRKPVIATIILTQACVCNFNHWIRFSAVGSYLLMMTFFTRTRAQHERLWCRGADGVWCGVARWSSPGATRCLSCSPLLHYAPANTTLCYYTDTVSLYLLNVWCIKIVLRKVYLLNTSRYLNESYFQKILCY